jgi:hypothetical protein
MLNKFYHRNTSACVIFFEVIAAEGEKKASHALKEAADIINQSANALQLRYLQTLSQISAEKNSTIIFPLPVDLLSSVQGSPRPMTSEMTFCKSRDSIIDIPTVTATAPTVGSPESGQEFDEDDGQQSLPGELVEVANILPPPPYC